MVAIQFSLHQDNLAGDLCTTLHKSIQGQQQQRIWKRALRTAAGTFDGRRKPAAEVDSVAFPDETGLTDGRGWGSVSATACANECGENDPQVTIWASGFPPAPSWIGVGLSGHPFRLSRGHDLPKPEGKMDRGA